jgi:hypothetical protein
MTASMSRSDGAREVFDRADRLFVRFLVGDVVRMERELPFAPSGAETVVRVEVPLRQSTEAVSAEIELRAGERALFRGATATTLSASAPTPVDFVLDPVVAAVTCGSDLVQLGAYGQTSQLAGAALFATGDTVPGVPVAWSTAASSVVSVSQAGLVTALRDGDATVTCGAANMHATRALRVFAVVNGAQVAPASATLVAGSSLPFTATLFDARGNLITTPRPLTWSSANTGVATVSATGMVTGVSVGSAQIVATSGSAAGSSVLSVVVPATALTIASTGVTGSTATIVGSVNPRGASTQGGFEWGTDPALATSTSTTAQALGSGAADVNITQSITGLAPNTTYYFRTVASNAVGTVRGAILSFRTPAQPSATTIGLDAGQAYTVLGQVTPNASATLAWFEFGTSATLDDATKTAEQAVGSGFTAVSVTQFLAGLQPSTTYFVRIVASNIGGTTAGAVASFRTGSAPTVNAPEVSVPANSCQTAVVTSAGTPNGLPTLAWIEYSGSSTLSSFNATTNLALGSGVTPVPFAGAIFGTRTIYFRAAAANQYGTARSAIQSIAVASCAR